MFQTTAPLYNDDHPTAIKDEYIVVLKNELEISEGICTLKYKPCSMQSHVFLVLDFSVFLCLKLNF